MLFQLQMKPLETAVTVALLLLAIMRCDHDM